MNAERQLELQAYLDGELSGWRASRVARWIESDPEARQLLAELKTTREFLTDNEVERGVPVEAGFYWRQIEQAIERCETAAGAASAAPAALNWRRLFAPLAGVAMAVFLAVLAFNNRDPLAPVVLTPVVVDEAVVHIAEVENLSEDTDSFSFRADNMFVVWVHNKAADVERTESELMDIEEFWAQ